MLRFRREFKHFKHIDILVNNAGIGAPNPAERVNEKDFDDTLNVNLKGTFFTSQAVGKIMIKQKRGRIINICSQAGFVALPTESVYCMTKAAIAHLTKCLALEWAPYNITVNAVAPTFITTPGTKKWLDNSAFRASVKKRIPLGRIGNPKKWRDRLCFSRHLRLRSLREKRSWWMAAGLFNRILSWFKTLVLLFDGLRRYK